MYLDALSSCAELNEEHAARAAESADAMRELLEWATRTAQPEDGAPRLLWVLGRLATAEWVDGTPIVEIRGSETVTKISVFADVGLGIRERLLPLARLSVSFEEFEQALMIHPELAAPLVPSAREGAIVLAPPEATEESAEPIAIDERSLHEQERKTAPPPPVMTGPRPKPINDESGLHTHPTVRRMVAVRPEALRRGGGDDD